MEKNPKHYKILLKNKTETSGPRKKGWWNVSFPLGDALWGKELYTSQSSLLF